jgi:hypothetical protein
MKFVLSFAALLISTNAFAQDVVPKVGGKPLLQVKPTAPTGCKLVGSVKGTKLWAGNCTAETSGAAPAADPQLSSVPGQATGTIPAGEKK